MAKALKKDTKYRILDIQVKETIYGARQVWTLRKLGETEDLRVWTPSSIACLVTDNVGAVCERKKTLLMQLILHFKDYSGPVERPFRYNLEFLKASP